MPIIYAGDKIYIETIKDLLNIAKEEIAKGFFVSLSELESLMGKEKFCPDAIQYFNKLKSIEKL